MLQTVIPIANVDLKTGVSTDGPILNGGVGAPEWLAMVDSSGIVCAVVHSLPNGTDVTTKMGLIHRPFAAQVAATANSYSRAGIGVSTANLYLHAANVPGFDAEISSGAAGAYNFTINPYGGDPSTWGTSKDPYIGQRIGGANFQAGGLPLYDKNRVKVGGIGVSGDFRCTDHVIAWKVREQLDNGAYTATNNPGGLASDHTDAMIQDIDPVTGKTLCARMPETLAPDLISELFGANQHVRDLNIPRSPDSNQSCPPQ